MRPRGVLFDLDDTLTHRRGCVERFARPFAQEWGSRLEPIEPTALCEALIAADRGGYNPLRAEDLLDLLLGVALERLGVEAADAWFVGDHPVNDVQGSEAAGMAGIWIRDAHRWLAGAPLPQRTIAGFEELPALLGAGS